MTSWTPTRVRELMEANVVGPVRCCRGAVGRLSPRHGGQGGSVVLTGSVASRLGSPGGFVDDAASKRVVSTRGHGLAREVAGEGIRVDPCCTGSILDVAGGR